MNRLIRLLGSLTLAVPLLVIIAAVLAWGTIYEARFGTAAVQRFVYHSWWFQALLAFLAVNLALAALERCPWQRKHTPFVLAHLGIILILLGGILGSRLGVEGQLIIPEGQSQHTLQLSGNVIVVHQPNPGLHQMFPTNFETQAWVHEPRATFPVAIDGRQVRLTVDRYYPDAVADEEITADGPAENPAARVVLEHGEQQDAIWLLARDPERFGVGWGDAHVLLLEPRDDEQLNQLLGRAGTATHPRGVVSLKLPGMPRPQQIPVPATAQQTIAVKGTPYRVTFKDYFPDFAMTEQGVGSRSDQPNNPAVSFVLTGPEGSDVYLLFALHPEFQTMHGFAHKVPAEVTYAHAVTAILPPNSIGLIRALSSDALLAVMTGSGAERRVINPLVIGTRYTHPALGYTFRVQAYYPRANVMQHVVNRSNDIKAEALHVVGEEGVDVAQAWVGLRDTAELAIGKEPLLVEYRPGERELPFAVKLLQFRKLTYPGTDMASAFESDVELTDTRRGVTLKRTISMNNPLRYRGFHLYQSSYVEGPTPTTILSVRNDPGTPFVYAGFLIVIAGVVSLFVFRKPAPRS